MGTYCTGGNQARCSLRAKSYTTYTIKTGIPRNSKGRKDADEAQKTREEVLKQDSKAPIDSMFSRVLLQRDGRSRRLSPRMSTI